MMKLPSGSNLNKIEALAQQVGNGGSGSGVTQVSAIAAYNSGDETERVSVDLSGYATAGTLINLDVACSAEKLVVKWGGSQTYPADPLFLFEINGHLKTQYLSELINEVGGTVLIVGSVQLKGMSFDLPEDGSNPAQHVDFAWFCAGGMLSVYGATTTVPAGTTTPDGTTPPVVL